MVTVKRPLKWLMMGFLTCTVAYLWAIEIIPRVIYWPFLSRTYQDDHLKSACDRLKSGMTIHDAVATIHGRDNPSKEGFEVFEGRDKLFFEDPSGTCEIDVSAGSGRIGQATFSDHGESRISGTE